MELRIFGIPIISYRTSHETDGVNLTNPDEFLRLFGNGRRSKSGQDVSEETALAFSAVYACVRILAETVASLSLGVYKRTDDGKEPVPQHPTYKLLHDTPNQYMTSFTFRETMMAFVALWGNAYARITFRGDMRVEALDILHPSAVMPFIAADGKLYYSVQYPDKRVVLAAYEMLHIPGLSFDGIKGRSPIDVAKEAIGLGLAAEEFGADFFGKGANSDIVLSYPGALSPKGQKNLGESFDHKYRGVDAGKTIVLEEGIKVERVTIPPDAAQFLQTRKFQVAEVARIFRVPLHMINELDRSTNNNIEHQSIEFVMHTIRPWVKRFEAEFDRKLFYEAEKGQVFTKFNLDSLQRGDAASRATILSALFNNGSISINEIRGMNGFNSVPGGERRFVNAGLVPLGADGAPEKDQNDGEGS